MKRFSLKITAAVNRFRLNTNVTACRIHNSMFQVKTNKFTS